MDKLQSYTEYAVRFAEQMYRTDQYKEKKEYVYNYILKKSNELGYDFTEEDIDIMVEGIVNLVKYGGE